MIVFDFETYAIVNRSPTMPIPVGVAFKDTRDGMPTQYYAWGHQSNNNKTEEEGKILVKDILTCGEDLLCHNAKFDVRVAMEWCDLPWPNVMVHDTMLMAYIVDPRERSLALKKLADKYTGMPPLEQKDLRDWIVANVPDATLKTWGAYIAYAPVELVAPYAIGDVDRTLALYNYFSKRIEHAQEYTV